MIGEMPEAEAGSDIHQYLWSLLTNHGVAGDGLNPDVLAEFMPLDLGWWKVKKVKDEQHHHLHWSLGEAGEGMDLVLVQRQDDGGESYLRAVLAETAGVNQGVVAGPYIFDHLTEIRSQRNFWGATTGLSLIGRGNNRHPIEVCLDRNGVCLPQSQQLAA